MTQYFEEKYPDRFYNIGIAEANMVGIAAGFAACGATAFVNTFAIFATGRVYDQIRNSVAYPRLNVKIVGSHSGVTVGEDGATHQALEDISPVSYTHLDVYKRQVLHRGESGGGFICRYLSLLWQH